MRLGFEVAATDGPARAGRLWTGRGEVATPCFMPVATQASVKALAPSEVVAAGAGMVIMNTYHLWLRPGPELVSELGGLHEFSRWPGLIATDSGGFQAFSLSDRTKVSEDGFTFASHLDGARMHLTPEESMRIQGLLASDIALQLDVCPPGGASAEDHDAACARTSRWARRCLRSLPEEQALFGIVQGGTDVARRRRHADELANITEAGRAFDGLALGGFSVGEPAADMWTTLAEVAPAVDPARPRYLMGVGTPADVVHGVASGIDVFDCVLPTRNARNGTVYTAGGKLNMKNARFRDDREVLDATCGCETCSGGWSRAALRHLFVAGELLALRLLSLHNVAFYQRLVREMREAVLAGELSPWLERWQPVLGGPAPSVRNG